MPTSDNYSDSVARLKVLKKRQRRFQIELLIAVAVISLLLGFVMGAGWHYTKTRIDGGADPAAPEQVGMSLHRVRGLNT